MVMTNAKVNDDKAAKDQVLPHCILIMDRGYCDFGLFKALDAKGVVFVTRLKTNWHFKRTGQGVIDTNYGDFKIQFTSVTAINKVGKDNEFRAVKWYSKEDDRWFVFLTNASDDITAEQVAKQCRTCSNLDSRYNRLTADVSTKIFKASMELLKPRQVHSIEPHDNERPDRMA